LLAAAHFAYFGAASAKEIIKSYKSIVAKLRFVHVIVCTRTVVSLFSLPFQSSDSILPTDACRRCRLLHVIL
jgi:hypothetical protein